jgi:hypothetical protein
MNMLKARLYDFELKKKKKKAKRSSPLSQKLVGVIKLDLMYFTLTEWLKIIELTLKAQIQIRY